MMIVTMVSLMVVWRDGFAASRRVMVENWFWSATHNKTGSFAVSIGRQNSLKAWLPD